MKGSEHFTRVIIEYLNQRAMTDPLLASNLTKRAKARTAKQGEAVTIQKTLFDL